MKCRCFWHHNTRVPAGEPLTRMDLRSLRLLLPSREFLQQAQQVPSPYSCFVHFGKNRDGHSKYPEQPNIKPVLQYFYYFKKRSGSFHLRNALILTRSEISSFTLSKRLKIYRLPLKKVICVWEWVPGLKTHPLPLESPPPSPPGSWLVLELSKGSHFLIKTYPTMVITWRAKSSNRFIITTVWK